MENPFYKVYCAGPLFNHAERAEMERIDSVLTANGFHTFLPHRDGLEHYKCTDILMQRGFCKDLANTIVSKAIFALDVYQVLYECDGLVANLNGRVPDEGMVAEVSMAWTTGKSIVGYKADSRALINGQDNPLVLGLFNFQLCDSLESIPESLKIMIEEKNSKSKENKIIKDDQSFLIQYGARIWQSLKDGRNISDIFNVLTKNNNMNPLSDSGEQIDKQNFESGRL